MHCFDVFVFLNFSVLSFLYDFINCSKRHALSSSFARRRCLSICAFAILVWIFAMLLLFFFCCCPSFALIPEDRTEAHIRKFIQSNHMHPIKVMAWNIHWIYVKHNTYKHLFTQQIEHRNCLVFTMLLATRKAPPSRSLPASRFSLIYVVVMPLIFEHKFCIFILFSFYFSLMSLHRFICAQECVHTITIERLKQQIKKKNKMHRKKLHLFTFRQCTNDNDE